MKCFFHKWGKWEQYEVPIKVMLSILAPKESRGKLFNDVELRQRRHCQKCNKMQDTLVRDD